MKRLVGICIVAGLSTLGVNGSYAASIVSEWNEATLQAIRVTRPGPTIVARALAITHTCIYDAWAAYDAHALGTRFGKGLRRPVAERTEANKREAVSHAAYRALVNLFPSQQASFDALMNQHGYNPANTTTRLNSAAGVGNVACQSVLDYRRDDGANQAGAYADYTGYAPVNTPDVVNDIGRWQPLRINGVEQRFLTPHWGGVKGFALKRYDQFRIPRPARPGTHAFIEQAKQVVAYSAMLNDQQKVIAEYWADGPASELPPGHWALFAQVVSERDGHGIDDDAKLFFALTNATFDVSIATWGYKREFDYVRPVTAIQELFRGEMIEAWAGEGQGTGEIAGDTWRPYQASNVVTPPFAEYVSGHSTFSAAAAEVLKRFTGSDVFKHSVTIPAGESRVEYGLVPANAITLSWATFTEAADEAGMSRRYGGIHFPDGDLNGRALGRAIGANAWEKAVSLFNPGHGRH